MRAPSSLLVRASLSLLGAGLFLACLGGCDQGLETIALRVSHRVYPDFQESHRVGPGETFAIGDTDYSARVVEFVPDFALDDRTMRVISRTKELRNPAVRIEVYQGDKKVDEVWAFRGEGPPHFGRSSLLMFRIEELVWKPGHEPTSPASASDSTAGPGDTTRTIRSSPVELPGTQ